MKRRQQGSPLVINLTANAGSLPAKATEPPMFQTGQSEVEGLIAGARPALTVWLLPSHGTTSCLLLWCACSPGAGGCCGPFRS